ncbi:hypothetical protein [Rhizobium sp. MHM7A]|uniref:hypothetical protein n=1 Tax=Rhizobium sp. MHM7A TaxID=2583233 RepID=UPI001107347F|nr:hypothetical protein [Rhizobium sp. MHM7A]TLX17211.1 hypothetical protein FFR93_07900 [Rhizobium sp. MHM7A]
MTAVIRDQVFETNSSSSHSVALGKGDVLDKNFDQESLRAGFINIRCGEHSYYGEERYRYYQPENIVKYLLATIIQGGPDTTGIDISKPYDAIPLLRQQFVGVSDLVDAIEDETKCKLTLIVEGGKRVWLDIDNEGSADFDFTDRESLRKLLFLSGSYVETKSRDEREEDAPEYIDTDMGQELTLHPGEGRQLGFAM